ncbi:MAG: class III signal peptide-containing protein [Methanobacterium sp.]
MAFLDDEGGQAIAEYILLFGGVIIIALTAIFVYRNYVDATSPLNASSDLNKVRPSVK